MGEILKSKKKVSQARVRKIFLSFIKEKRCEDNLFRLILCACVILLPGDPVTPVTVIIITSNYRHASKSLLSNIPYQFL